MSNPIVAVPSEKTAILNLTGGQGDYHGLVSTEDLGRVLDHKWSPARMIKYNRVYVQKTNDIGMLHQFIAEELEKPDVECSLDVDHINDCGLDNRRENLRWIPSSLNSTRSLDSKSKKSGLPVGVCKNPRPGSEYLVQASGKYLGVYDDLIAAKNTYLLAKIAAVHHRWDGRFNGVLDFNPQCERIPVRAAKHIEEKIGPISPIIEIISE